MTGWDEALTAELPQAVELRRKLHRDPHVGGDEHPTAAVVAAAIGSPDAPAVAEGRIIRIGPATGPAIAVRAELDALPIQERTSVPWASTNGAMHACGHDVHLAALTAFARAAGKVELPYALLAVLQPREESFPLGAKDVVDSAELARHDVRAMIGAHVQPRVRFGEVAATPGPVNASFDTVTITVTGRGGHAAYPQDARDPIVAAAAIVLALQQIVSRRTDPLAPTVLTIGAINGGHAANVIPETAVLRASLRTFTQSERERLLGLIESIATSTAAAYGCTAAASDELGEPVLDNDPELTELVWPELATAGLRLSDPLRSCGSDDFSFYCERFPSLMMFVGTRTGGFDVQPSLHSPTFLPVEETIGLVAKSMLAGYLGACRLISRS
ncbi:M20 metallopeptidase family protein [Fodinicola acaciae]|uniref:M20 metallopeptidase family protein n=1 Tax=Fodinicola acaciae TaxID=2681555 RepID=UPI0013D352F2|nr:amidohydrolase [Fodinicola acaciae]